MKNSPDMKEQMLLLQQDKQEVAAKNSRKSRVHAPPGKNYRGPSHQCLKIGQFGSRVCGFSSQRDQNPAARSSSPWQRHQFHQEEVDPRPGFEVPNPEPPSPSVGNGEGSAERLVGWRCLLASDWSEGSSVAVGANR